MQEVLEEAYYAYFRKIKIDLHREDGRIHTFINI
jgi:hypothetical protein